VVSNGGAIVEFNGDGMMAVFGAPESLAHKESAAVLAARQLVAELGALAAHGPRLEVGVGIATGPAYVGSIQSVDRAIWSATTRRVRPHRRKHVCGAPEAAKDFSGLAAVRIRGREQPEDIYVLARA
jgi:class 3 adenylate cyclase